MFRAAVTAVVNARVAFLTTTSRLTGPEKKLILETVMVEELELPRGLFRVDGRGVRPKSGVTITTPFHTG
jgi:hypothetical protein